MWLHTRLLLSGERYVVDASSGSLRRRGVSSRRQTDARRNPAGS